MILIVIGFWHQGSAITTTNNQTIKMELCFLPVIVMFCWLVFCFKTRKEGQRHYGLKVSYKSLKVDSGFKYPGSLVIKRRKRQIDRKMKEIEMIDK